MTEIPVVVHPSNLRQPARGQWLPIEGITDEPRRSTWVRVCDQRGALLCRDGAPTHYLLFPKI